MEKVKIEDIYKFLVDVQVNPTLIGNVDQYVEGFSSLAQYRKNTITWIKSLKNLNILKDLSDVTLVIAQNGITIDAPNIIYTNESKKAFFAVIEKFFSNNKVCEKIGRGTYISPEVEIGENVYIGHNCVLEGNISIGNNTIIHNNVVIVNTTTIGEDCEIHSQVVVGEDGFGTIADKEKHLSMVKHYGGVVIEDRVFIGNHVNIARGTIDNTVIESGVKIAPSTHIGHNNHISADSTIICSNLFGTVVVEKNAYIVSSTIRNQCRVGENSIVGMGSIVVKDVEKNSVVIGNPAKKIKKVIDK